MRSVPDDFFAEDNGVPNKSFVPRMNRQLLVFEVDNILTTLQNDGATDDMSHNWDADLTEAKGNLFKAIDRYVEEELKKVRLEKDIKYHTLKARYQRVFLGGEEDALPTKRYVRRLKALRQQVKEGDDVAS